MVYIDVGVGFAADVGVDVDCITKAEVDPHCRPGQVFVVQNGVLNSISTSGGILGPKSRFWQQMPFLTVFGDFSSLSVRALSVPETNI